MDRTGTPQELWYHCIVYVAYVLNRVSDPSLNFHEPIFRATGNIGDISAITTFQWYEPVYFKLDNSQFTFPDTGEGFGHFVGIAENVGHEMTYKIWKPDTNRIIHRSRVRSANELAHINQHLGFTPSSDLTNGENLSSSQYHGEGLNFRPTDHIYSIRDNDRSES